VNLTTYLNKRSWISKLLVVLLSLVWLSFGVYFAYLMQNRDHVVYNCELSEISPDFPPKVREECRKLRAQSGRI
jgi:hypothetical protein